MGVDFMARFRLYEGTPASLSSSGQVANGEVEDYFWMFDDPTAVTLQTFSAAGNGTVGLIVIIVSLLLAAGSFLFIRRRRQLMD